MPGLCNMNEWWRWHRSHILARLEVISCVMWLIYRSHHRGGNGSNFLTEITYNSQSNSKLCIQKKIITHQTPSATCPFVSYWSPKIWTRHSKFFRPIDSIMSGTAVTTILLNNQPPRKIAWKNIEQLSKNEKKATLIKQWILLYPMFAQTYEMRYIICQRHILWPNQLHQFIQNIMA